MAIDRVTYKILTLNLSSPITHRFTSNEVEKEDVHVNLLSFVQVLDSIINITIISIRIVIWSNARLCRDPCSLSPEESHLGCPLGPIINYGP